MNREILRDYWVGAASEDRRLFYARPVKEWLKWSLRLIEYLLARYLGWLYQIFVHKRRLGKGGKYARIKDQRFFSWYLPGRPYFEIQIGNDTRCSAILAESDEFSFERKVDRILDRDKDLLFGMAPLVGTAQTALVKKWNCRVKIKDLTSGEIHSWEERFPFNGRSERFAYYPGDGWAEFRISLTPYVGRNIRVTISGTPAVSLATPQLIARKEKARNVLLISFESLTDFRYLRERYGNRVGELPNLERLCGESVVYPKVYSPTDCTLSFAASILTGLMPSQHGIGNYAIAADSFENSVYHPELRTLPGMFKDHRFLTFFGGTQVRFSSKVGWARGFDHYFHVFDKWGTNTPQFDWLTRAFRTYKEYDKFFYTHIDFLHEPLLAFNDRERMRLLDLPHLQSNPEEALANLYFEQLHELDFQLGLFLDYLKNSGQWDQTAIVITGDHGGGLHFVKHSEFALFEERVRVPLIVKYPDWQANPLERKPITNSISEIYRVLHHLLSQKLPDYLAALPQYQPEYSQYAFSETIMNPNRQYKRYNLAVMNHPYKYVVWREVDWDRFKPEAKSKESLFQSNGETYQEEKDLCHDQPKAAEKYRQLTEKVLEKNLRFMEKYPPQKY